MELGGGTIPLPENRLVDTVALTKTHYHGETKEGAGEKPSAGTGCGHMGSLAKQDDRYSVLFMDGCGGCVLRRQVADHWRIIL